MHENKRKFVYFSDVDLNFDWQFMITNKKQKYTDQWTRSGINKDRKKEKNIHF